MEAPGEIAGPGAGGSQGTGATAGSGPGGSSPTGGGGAGGQGASTGIGGAGDATSAGGGGAGGTTDAGLGGGGATGTGGVAGSGGVGAAGNTDAGVGSAGATGTGGTAGTGGGAAPSDGGAAGSGGAGGGAGAGAGGNVCPLGGVLDCSTAGALTLPDGQVADFSTAEDSTTTSWCDADGLRGSVFSYVGPSSTAAATIDTTAQNLKLNLTVGATGYAGGGLIFESCVNASSFTSVQFTAAITAGSMTGCTWQTQLQTQDQRRTVDTNPTGGTCNPDAGPACYRYPAASLAAPTATASAYTEAFTTFDNPSGSAIATPTQLVGIQWQVNSAASGTGTCTVELRIDNIKFQ